ncbi:hypothetical protein GQ53DRAFT_743571 [Thozetella sp. PMI_491]|nr:hypothetical protein GQ53DRAFT_743571 [Thozetella sp. PMI_491]
MAVTEPRDQYIFENQDSIPTGIYNVINELLRNWDNVVEDEDTTYLDNVFLPDATLFLGPTKTVGLDNIKLMRRSMIHPTQGPIVGVRHVFDRLYVLKKQGKPTMSKDVLFTGTVAYTIKGGEVVKEDFATRSDLIEVAAGKYKIQYNRIFVDSENLNKAITKLMIPSTRSSRL